MQKLIAYDGKEITRIRLSTKDHQPSHLLPHKDPTYPDVAKAQGIEGKVLLAVLVDRQGDVMEASVQSGDPLLAASALQTVRTWKYRPTTVNGVPVEVSTTVELTFTLPDTVASA